MEPGPPANAPQRFGQHGNAFGFLRLLFASAVILSHATPLLDGDAHRDPLYRLFGGESVGGLAVDGFFIISGFLITGSYLSSRSVASYFTKRVARIYPAFVVASLVCLLIVAPLGGGRVETLGIHDWLTRVKVMALLDRPYIPSSFVGSHYPDLNGPMWTIPYEFRCYLAIVALGLLGLFRRPWTIAILLISMLVLDALTPAWLVRHATGLPQQALWLGDIHAALRLGAMFLAGSLFYILGDRVPYPKPALTGAAVVTAIGLAIPPLTDIVVATAGAYLVLGWGKAPRGWVERINNRTDISYGVYLYGWPIAKVLTWYWPSISVPVLAVVSLGGAMICGTLSWWLVEKPMLKWSRRFSHDAPKPFGPAPRARASHVLRS